MPISWPVWYITLQFPAERGADAFRTGCTVDEIPRLRGGGKARTLLLCRYRSAASTVFSASDKMIQLLQDESALSPLEGARMAGPLSFQGIQEGEALERCDGCDHFHPIGELVPIGDGSIRVCRACYANATAMVLTSGFRQRLTGID